MFERPPVITSKRSGGCAPSTLSANQASRATWSMPGTAAPAAALAPGTAASAAVPAVTSSATEGSAQAELLEGRAVHDRAAGLARTQLVGARGQLEGAAQALLVGEGLDLRHHVLGQQLDAATPVLGADVALRAEEDERAGPHDLQHH